MIITRLLLIILSAAYGISAAAQVKDTILTETKTNNIWQLLSTIILTYDSDCKVKSTLARDWDAGTQTWRNASLSVNRYDDSGRVTKSLTQTWDANTHSWVNQQLFTGFYTQEGGGLKIVNLFQVWNGSGLTWDNSARFITIDNAAQNEYRFQFDLFINNAWQPNVRNLITFTNKDFLKEETAQNFFNGQWVNAYKNVYSYPGNNSGRRSAGFNWDQGNNNWIKTSRNAEDFVDGTNYTERYFSQFFFGTAWENSYRSENKYNADKILTNSFGQSWDAFLLKWTNASRLQQKYYPDGAIYQIENEFWDNLTSTWPNGYRTTYTNNGCRLSLKITPSMTENKTVAYKLLQLPDGKYAYTGQEQHTPVSEKKAAPFSIRPISGNGHQLYQEIISPASENNADGRAIRFNMIISTKPDAIASVVSDNAATTHKNSFTIYPNPARSYININPGENKYEGAMLLKLTDLSGKLMVQQKLQHSGTQRINLPVLQKGTYIVSLVTGNEINNQKLVIQ